MKYTLTISKNFKKSYKKLTKENKLLVYETIEKLLNDEILDKKYKDHQLKGNFKNYKECHIKPNLLLIYHKEKEKLILTCVHLGSHNDLF